MIRFRGVCGVRRAGNVTSHLLLAAAEEHSSVVPMVVLSG